MRTALMDGAIARAVGDGARTHIVAVRLGITTPQALRCLKRLEVAGTVKRSHRYSASNDIYWTRGSAPQESVR